ncbi:acetyltransferase [bacterium]|nr:acetyltransferase [bacterium]
MEKLILIGGGGHCKSCIDVIEGVKDFEIAGILDTPDKVGTEVLGYKIIGTDNDIGSYAKQGYYFLITVGQIKSADLRIKLYEKVKNAGGKFATVISPRAYVSKHACIEEGTIVMHDVLINAGAKIGKNCIINTKALIEHECIIKDNCHIAVGAVIAGEVEIGENSFVGANTTIVQCVKLPSKAFIKAGSLVK